MACLKTCTPRRAYRARRTRRIKSSVLPENIEPVMTMRDPVLRVVASRDDSKVRVMIRILPTTRPFTWPVRLQALNSIFTGRENSSRPPLTHIALLFAPFAPVIDGADHDHREQEDPCRHEEQA